MRARWEAHRTMELGTGKTAVVTGGGSGIGEAMCRAFAAEGLSVVVSDIDLSAAEGVANSINDTGGSAIAVRTDVSDRASVKDLAGKAFEAFGGVHVLCNNAGVVAFRSAAEMSDADWDWVMGVNLDGVINGVTQFLPRILEQGGEAHIVNTSSSAGLFAPPGMASYVASKQAVVGLSEHLNVDLAAVNVGVSVLCPGGVATRIVEAGRNRPDEHGGPEDVPDFAEPIRQGIAAGMPPSDVAARVVDAIRNNHLYIVTHEDTREGVEARLEGIRACYALND